MFRPSRRELIAGVLGGAAGVVLVGCGLGDTDRHPALRTPRRDGVVAMLAADGDPGSVRAAAGRLRRAATADLMVGLGAGFFEAAGLAERRPAGFTSMPRFPGEVLLPERTGADVMVQLEGDSATAVARRAAAVLGGLDGLRIVWTTAVSRSPVGSRDGRPLQRNTFGFVEGHGNPALGADAADQVLLPAGTAPGWAAGGSYLAVRVIRMAHALWDADDVVRQQRVIGRRADGGWLDGGAPFDTPGFAGGGDPDGAVTAIDSHVRRVNPRTPDQPPPRMLRRSWSYRGGEAAGGQPDEGMVFMAFQNDLAAGFVRAQQRLAGDALAAYLLVVGGGYFVVPTAAGLAALLA